MCSNPKWRQNKTATPEQTILTDAYFVQLQTSGQVTTQNSIMLPLTALTIVKVIFQVKAPVRLYIKSGCKQLLLTSSNDLHASMLKVG